MPGVFRAMNSVLHSVRRGDVVMEPFPHVVVDDALDPELYARLAATFPPADVIVDGREIANNAAYHLRTARLVDDARVDPTWKAFARAHTSAEFFREVVAIFGDAIRALHPDLESRLGCTLDDARTSVREAEPFADLALDCQPTYGSPVRQPSRTHPVHIDRPVALYAGLLYCRLPEDEGKGGDLELYRFRGGARRYDEHRYVDDALVDPVKRIPYAANRLVFFIHSPHSLHGVTVRSVTPWPRLHVNFLAEARTNIFELETAA
jgi:hypothetical protein